MPQPHHQAIEQLRERQDLIASRRQLRTVGINAKQEAAQVAAERWRFRPPNAVVLHNGPLTRVQECWVAVINAGELAGLCALTSLELDGLQGWSRSAVEVVVPKGTEVPPSQLVRVHESRRFDPIRDLHPTRRPPRTRTARSAVDAAAWSRRLRSSVGVLAAVVQQRLVRPEDLRAELELAGRVRWHRQLARALADIEGGAHALSEIDFAKLCRRYRLPEPVRQAVRLDPAGRRRYLDAEWVRPDGRRVVAEVDGALHLLPTRYWQDMERANDLVLDGRIVLRFAAYAVRAEESRVAQQLRRALVSG